MRKTAAKIASDQEWHRNYWKEDYKEIPEQFAFLCIRLDGLLNNLSELQRKCKNIETNRRQNAADLGVHIAESDRIYNLDEVLKGVPALVDKIKDQYKEMGWELPK